MVFDRDERLREKGTQHVVGAPVHPRHSLRRSHRYRDGDVACACARTTETAAAIVAPTVATLRRSGMQGQDGDRTTTVRRISSQVSQLLAINATAYEGLRQPPRNRVYRSASRGPHEPGS